MKMIDLAILGSSDFSVSLGGRICKKSLFKRKAFKSSHSLQHSAKTRIAGIVGASLLLLIALPGSLSAQSTANLTFPIVHTGIVKSYNDTREVPAIQAGQPFFGQDSSYQKNMPSYEKHPDGTVTDKITGLMWEADMGSKMTPEEAEKKASESRLGGYSDWRIPSIKELYSLIQYTGRAAGEKAGTMFIDTRHFKQPLGDPSTGEREIDAQTWSSTKYVGKVMNNDAVIFGVNFVDGRVKGYPILQPRTKQPNRMYFRLVRGNLKYGINQFVDNGDGTLSDLATGLMWQKEDSKKGMDWESALFYAENLVLAGKSDWRLPSAKELQSIVDYTRAPTVTGTPAINPLFLVSMVADPRGGNWSPFFWTGTTLLDGPKPGNQAIYATFAEALGKMNGKILDAHGAGAVRGDPKSGNAADYPKYFGPQGDIQIVFNYVRCVRSIP